jgi:hypothetical protein
VVGQYEDAIFQKRMRELRRQKDRIQRQKYEKQQVRGGRGSTVKRPAGAGGHVCKSSVGPGVSLAGPA